MKGLPPLPKPPPPAKKSRLPDSTRVVLFSIFCVCVGLPYVVKDRLGDDWARGTLGTTPLLWMLAAFFFIKPHWRTLTKQAADRLYIAILVGFIGQLAAIVAYVWAL